MLSDEEHEVAEKYGTWVEKSMYGNKYMGMERSTFVIDADGNVAKVMRKVKPADHAGNVLAVLSLGACRLAAHSLAARVDEVRR